MEKKDFIVNPWEVKGEIDYDKLIKEFGLSPISSLSKQFQENFLLKNI